MIQKANEGRRILESHRRTWSRKAILRWVYGDYYERIRGLLPVRREQVVEIGSGSGNFKEHMPSALATDCVPCEWLDAVFDAQRMPFGQDAVDAFVMIDVLHHIDSPAHFLQEVLRALRPGGRLIVVDPYVSPVSRLVFKLAHPELVDFSEDFYVDSGSEPSDPWDSNQAMATQLFWRDRERLSKTFPMLRMVHRSRFDWLIYPLSGGFRPYSFLPSFMAPVLRAASDWPFMSRLAGFRTLVCLEKEPG